MKRIDGQDVAADLFGPGKPGFREQVPGVSLATGLTAKWFNAVQESIVRTIEAAGIELSEANMGQFVEALSILDTAARNAAIVTATEVAALDATTKANGAKTAATNAATEAAAIDATTKANAAKTAAINAAAGDATTKVAALIPSGTRMLFQQTNAPVGWTKDATHNDKALRVVSGAAGSGGSLDFSAAFVNGNVGSTTLTIAQIPAHDHDTPVFAREGTSAHVGDGGSNSTYPGVKSGMTGGGAPHTHTIDLAIKYVDIIIATKD